ncbi:MAG: hypothetical protein ACRDV0_10795 [Acidimicrobiales bacterium]
MLLPSLALAQAAGSNYVSVNIAPSNFVYAPGTVGATLGTITLTGTQQGTIGVASLPVTFAGTNGASAANLSSCQFINANSTALNTGSNDPSVLSQGTNTMVFDTPLLITSGTPQTLTLRCNINSTAPSGASYSYSVGSPMLAPALTAILTEFPTVSPGEVNAPIAAITLNPSASGANLNLSSIPLTATYSGGLTTNDLSSCRLTNPAGAILNQNGTGLIVGGANTFSLNAPMPLAGGSAPIALILSCTVSSAAPLGGSLSLALSPPGIVATNASTGVAITPGQGYDPTTGAAGALSGTTYIGTASTGTVTPPNTGAGAAASGAAVALFLAALAALGSWGILVRKG